MKHPRCLDFHNDASDGDDHVMDVFDGFDRDVFYDDDVFDGDFDHVDDSASG